MADEQKANVVLTADNSQYDRSMRQSAQATQGVLTSVLALSNAMNKLAQNTGKKLQLVSASGAAGLTAATVAAAKFDQQMSTMQATSVLTGRSYENMAKQVNGLRGSFAVTTDQAIALMTQLNKMGQTSGVDKMAASMIKLSAVTGESLGSLTQGMIGLQRQMGTTGSAYTDKFAAGLANASAKAGVAATSVLDFSNAIAPIAKVAGLSTKEVMGFSTAFVKAGQDGGQAMTAFTHVLTNINRAVVNGSPELKAYSNLLGISVKQFKEMPKGEAAIRFFEEITKQGPDAVKTLERFGLEGARTMKALQGMANQGGVRQAMADVAEGMDDPKKFNEAAAASMDGLNDQLQKLGNNLSRVGQAFGVAFVGPLNGAIGQLNKIMAPLATMLEGLGKIPGFAAAAGVAIVGAVGTIVRSLGLLGGLAAFRAVTGGTTAAGFRAARSDVNGTRMPLWVARARNSMDADAARFRQDPTQGHMLRGGQRFTYRVGEALGRAIPAGIGSGPNAISRALGWGARGLGSFTRSGLEPLFWRNVSNPFNTGARLGGTGDAWRERRGEFARSAVNRGLGTRELFNRVGSMVGNDMGRRQTQAMQAERLAAQRAANAALNDMGRASRGQVGVLGTLKKESLALAKAMVSAAAGAAKLGAMGAVRAAPGIGRGLASAGSSLAGFMGGPWGLAMMGGLALFSGIQSQKAEHKKNLLVGSEAEMSDSVTGPYKIALNEAARATTTFADIVRKNSSSMVSQDKAGLVAGQQPGVISNEMYKEARRPGATYANTKIGSMGYDEAKQFVQSGLMSDKDRVVLGYDLSKRFSKDQAQELLNTQSALDGGVDLKSLYSGIKGTKKWGPWQQASDKAADATKRVSQTGQEDLDEITDKYGFRSGAQYQIAHINAASQQSLRMPRPIQDQTFSGLSAVLGSKADEASQRDWKYLFQPGFEEDEFGARTYRAANTAEALERLNADPSAYKSSFAQALKSVQENAGPQASYTATQWAPGGPLVAQQGVNALPAIPMAMQQSVASSTALGKAVMSDSEIGKLLNEAAAAPADANLQQRAMKALASVAVDLTGDFSEAQGELQRMKNAVGDTSDQLYGLAANAQAVVAQRQSEALAWSSTRAGQTSAMRMNFTQAKQNTLVNPGPESETEFEASRSKLQEGVTAGKEYFKQLYVQIREFGIAQQRAQTDFDLQREHQDHDFYLNRDRQEEDFQRNRERQEDSYARQLKRQTRDYNLQRKYAQNDFDKQRRRSEADFQHQVKLMTEQTARTVMNVYERINTKRSWDAQNLLVNMKDQQSSLDGQLNNLSTVRGAGISSDVIKMLGLNEAENAQQLARFTAEIMESPELVKAYNDAAKKRLASSKKLVTDEDNVQWQEMQRSFKLSADRAIEDFDLSMKRQAQAFRTGLADQRTEFKISTGLATEDYKRARERQLTDYNISVDRMVTMMNTQMGRAKDDLNRNTEEITLSFEELSDAAIKGLSGTAAKQAKALRTELNKAATEIKSITKTLVTDVAHLFKNWGGVTGVTSGGMDKIGEGTRQVGGQTKDAADGGYIGGWSPHPKADNIAARLTAGEYVHKVDSVNHYGQGFMDAVNNKRFPRELAQHYADGGLVSFGKRLQKMDYQVGEHPLFGGVAPVHTKNSWHYKAGAIDVNYDGHSVEEKIGINRIVQMAREYGLRTIWQTAGHFDHAHFDIGAGPDMIGPGVPTGPRSMGEDPIVGAIRKLKSYKKWEKLRSSNYGLRSNINKDQLAEHIAMSFMPDGSGDLTDGVKLKGNRGANQALGKRMAAARGWTGPNWDALNWIYMKESGWDQYADNPTSDAYGIPQSLPGSKMASAGSDWLSNPETQIKWGLGYIAERYGSPVEAQKFWKANNWYGDGALFTGGAQKVVGVGERGPEMILPLDQRGVDYMLAVFKQFTAADAKRVIGTSRGVPTQSAGSTNYYSRIDRSTQIHGPITVQSNDPRDMLRKLEAEKRISALTSPRSSR